MKKLLFGLIATVMFGFVGNAQTSKIDLEKMFGPLVNYPVPPTLEREIELKKDNIVPIYLSETKAWVIIATDNNAIPHVYASTGASIPQSFSDGLAKRKAPHRNCEDKPSDFGVILCMYNNCVEAIMGLF
jgi:hypothetical protein